MQHGADPNARDALGRVPLHFAYTPEQVALLIRYGANVLTLTPDGDNVLEAFMVPALRWTILTFRYSTYTEALDMLYECTKVPSAPSTPPRGGDIDAPLKHDPYETRRREGVKLLREIADVAQRLTRPAHARLPVRRALFR